MFTSIDKQGKPHNADDLLGLRISAGLLFALGCLFVLYTLLSLLVFFLERSIGLGVVTKRGFLGPFIMFLLGPACAAVAYLCFRAAKALRFAQRWAANVAIGFGVLLLLFSGDILYDWNHPHKQAPDEYFGVVLLPFFVIVGLWWCIYLNLPKVRGVLSATNKPQA